MCSGRQREGTKTGGGEGGRQCSRILHSILICANVCSEFGWRHRTFTFWQAPVANIAPEEGSEVRDCWSVAFGGSYTDDERCVAAGYDNGDLKLFDLRTMSLRWETHLPNGKNVFFFLIIINSNSSSSSSIVVVFFFFFSLNVDVDGVLYQL